jgi:hypothetical protein
MEYLYKNEHWDSLYQIINSQWHPVFITLFNIPEALLFTMVTLYNSDFLLSVGLVISVHLYVQIMKTTYHLPFYLEKYICGFFEEYENT